MLQLGAATNVTILSMVMSLLLGVTCQMAVGQKVQRPETIGPSGSVALPSVFDSVFDQQGGLSSGLISDPFSQARQMTVGGWSPGTSDQYTRVARAELPNHVRPESPQIRPKETRPETPQLDATTHPADISNQEPTIVPLPLPLEYEPEPTTHIVAESVIPPGCTQCGTQASCFNCRSRSGTRIGRFMRGFYQGLCCPDPCYQPKWEMLANASFFTDAVRPQSRQRIRWDHHSNFEFQDRAEYFWAQSGSLGPDVESSVDYDELTMYIETGGDKFSFFIETPYRAIDLNDSGGHFAGFADLTTGTKSLLHDTELFQVAFQFETHIPTASPSKGLSNGHVSLEPGLLLGLKLSPVSYLQAQVSEWIPIAGDPDHAGALLKYSASYNRKLWQAAEGTSLIGTIEYTGVSFQDGLYTLRTNPGVTPATFATFPASNETFSMLGAGLRYNICDKVNFGVGSQFTLTDDHWAETSIRTEFQIQY